MTADNLAPAAGYYLGNLLAPLGAWLERRDVTDIYVNREQEVWVEALGGSIECHPCPALTEPVLARLARQIAAASAQGINREHPLLAANLPDGSRVQIAAPPATRGGHVMAIRRHVAANPSLGDYEEAGAFDGASTEVVTFDREALLVPVAPADIRSVLQNAVQRRRNILVSGGTSTGKTTFLNALLREIPSDQRLVLIEDTPELEVTHRNSIGLLAARSALGEAEVSAEDLLIASLRMRPDRIILGELRGAEAFTFLRAINTGHPGSMTTIHADSPSRAVEQLALLVLQAGSRLTREDVRHYVRQSIDVFVQLERRSGLRKVTQVLVKADRP
ncbi:P-type DNA transfer ATPase VirB11 [Croceibacterium sp. LX-88]|uniref:P-type DNA transfer ATPase VirB11 n=1 Tax=Croceibacterium selenioxidans TaxID=2838833 RepID=A0ABS5W4Q0_9SPHN|nr:P-type DNA transfer ATPase VirB11 [Croceibacterium selenioxidans]MBT2134659.1 P-type DNA transfer ATPase VirB11 [Croceibacterium selenioxidans]